MYIHPVDLENLKAWSQQNLWFIVNDDNDGKWQIDGCDLKIDPSLHREEVRVE